jgi:hypothetical protein
MTVDRQATDHDLHLAVGPLEDNETAKQIQRADRHHREDRRFGTRECRD